MARHWHALRFIRKKASSPPLGLLTVAAMLPADWTVRLVDENVRKLTRRDLAWALDRVLDRQAAIGPAADPAAALAAEALAIQEVDLRTNRAIGNHDEPKPSRNPRPTARDA